MLQNNEQGADGVMYVALTPELEKDAGKYFQNCSTFCTNSQVTNTDVQKKLWEASCKATGWSDSINTSKPKIAPTRKNTPAIVITKDSGAESISSAKSKTTKDDLERDDDSENDNDNRKRQSVTSTSSSETGPNKIQVKISDKATGLSSPTDTGEAIPPSVG